MTYGTRDRPGGVGKDTIHRAFHLLTVDVHAQRFVPDTWVDIQGSCQTLPPTSSVEYAETEKW